MIFILSLILLTILFVCPVSASASNLEKTPIDIYLIGGQSNAAGYSSKGMLSESFANVGYAGETDRVYNGDVSFSNVNSYSDYKWSVTAGLGRNSNYIGPEYGMAKALAQYYSKEKPAFIFKDAGGATALLESPTDQNPCGNWYPRSFWEESIQEYVRGLRKLFLL